MARWNIQMIISVCDLILIMDVSYVNLLYEGYKTLDTVSQNIKNTR